MPRKGKQTRKKKNEKVNKKTSVSKKTYKPKKEPAKKAKKSRRTVAASKKDVKPIFEIVAEKKKKAKQSRKRKRKKATQVKKSIHKQSEVPREQIQHLLDTRKPYSSKNYVKISEDDSSKLVQAGKRVEKGQLKMAFYATGFFFYRKI